MTHQNLKDPLHGVTLEVILKRLVEQIGWKGLGASIPVRCFLFEPTITSSLRFFRKTPWAREKVERLYVKVFKKRFCETPAGLKGQAVSECLPPKTCPTKGK